MRKLLASANEAANSWNQKELVNELKSRSLEFGRTVSQTQIEQWQVNAAIHFNSWDNLTTEDFSPVVAAFRNLLSAFTCSECGEYLYVSPDRESPETIRCDCGKTTINLRKK